MKTENSIVRKTWIETVHEMYYDVIRYEVEYSDGRVEIEETSLPIGD
jgi:hypothetical protein